MKNKCAIVLNGKIENYSFLKKKIKGYKTIIAADGGMNHLKKIDVLPDILLGDFDSFDLKGLDKNIKIKKYKTDKNFTDGEIAIDYIINKNIKKVDIYGALGNRIDHLLANVHLLEKLLLNKITGRIITYNNILKMFDDEITIKSKEFEYFEVFSILAYSKVIKGLSIKNAKYPLNNKTLYRKNTLGISNEFLKKDIKISIKNGIGIAVLSRD
ncbi:MAG: thiamine diphosphokinase [Bacillota bacterium]